MSKKLLVEIVGDSSSLERSLRASGAAADGFGSKLGSLAKTALLVGGAAALGGLAVVLDKSIHAAMAGQTAQAALDQSLKNTHQSVKAMTPALEKAAESARKMGFENAEAEVALSRLETATGSTKRSTADLGVAMDIARFKHTSLTNASQMLAMAMTGSQRAAKQLGITVAPLTTNVDALKASHENLTTAIGMADLAHAKLLDKMATGNAVIAAVTDKVHGQAQAYAETAAGGMASFSAQIDFMEEKLGNALLPTLVKVMSWVNEHWPQIQAVFQAVFHAIGAAIEFVKPYLSEFIAFSERVVGYVRDHWPEISATVNRVLTNVKYYIDQVTSAGRAVWEKFGSTITSVASIAFGAVKGYVTNMYAAITGVFTLIGDLIHGRWSKIWGDLVNIVSRELEALWSLLRGVAGIAGTILYNAGQAVINGFVSGIKSMFGSVKSTLGNLTHSLTSWKGPPSVDSVLLYGSGVMIMQGFQHGLESQYPAIRQSLNAFTNFVAADAYRGVGQAVQRIQESFKVTATGGGSGLPMTPTQFKNTAGQYVSDSYVQDQIAASLAANPNASGGGYEGAVPMGSQIVNNNVSFPNYVGSKTELMQTIRDGLVNLGRREPDIFGGLA